MLGIVIGVMTTALVTVFGSAVENQVQDEFKNLNVNTLIMFPEGRDAKLSTNDEKILEQSPYVKSISADIGDFFLASNSLNTNVDTFYMRGVKESYFDLYNIELAAGWIFDESMSQDKLAVIWSKVFEDLFDADHPDQVIWESLTIDSKKYQVIWVLEEIWEWFGPSFDDEIMLPIEAVTRFHIKYKKPSFSLLINNVENMEAAKRDLTQRFRKQHKLIGNDPDGFRFFDAGGVITTYTQLTELISYLLLGISIFILIVSGVGIMNVMFAWVAERTKEIWILKSIGATKKDIQNQFVIEAVIITLLSGLMWVVLAEIIITIVTFIDLPITLVRSFWGDVLALSFAWVVGVVSGRYPAVRAADLDPVDALRS